MEKMEAIRLFYDVVWNKHDKNVIPVILHKDLTFRGSLGEEKSGHKGFEEYLDSVHEAIEDFKCEILETVSEGNKVFCKMNFYGTQRGKLLGYDSRDSYVSWHGAALFTFEDELIKDLWVLGDLYSLMKQLEK